MILLKIINREERLSLLSVFMGFMVFFSIPFTAQAQYQYDYEWLFGYNAYPAGVNSDKRFAINLVSFHSNPPDTIRTPLIGSTGAASTLSIADSKGEILFYSNGCRLFNADGRMVEGGEVLLSGPTYNRNCYISDNLSIEAYPSWIQSRFILPMDNNDSLFFFLFHRYELTHHTNFQEPWGIVAFDLHLGRLELVGEVFKMVSNEVILGQMMSNGKMIAVKSSKPNYWWVIVPPHIGGNFEVIHLGPQGVDTTVTHLAEFSTLGLDDKWMVGGQSVISPEGDKYAWWSPADTIGTLLFDFDRTSGELSNLRHLPHPERNNYEPGISSGGGGSAISPNGRFLYINTRNNLYQYDLEASDILGSKVHIAEYDGFRDPSFNLQTSFFMQQLAPDCRIYMSSTNGVSYLHVINHPNRKGKACDFQQHSFKLPGNHQFGLPYHPNYRLGTDYPVCDSTLTSTTTVLPEEEGGIHIYPNPARDYAVVEWSRIDPVGIQLYDLTGRLLLQDRIIPGSPEYYLELDHLSSGMYLIKLQDREGRYVTERLVVKR